MIDYPTTKEQAERLRYFRWAGNPQGTAYRPERCAYQVWERGRGIRAYQCLRKPGYGPDKLYCKQHAKRVSDDEEA